MTEELVIFPTVATPLADEQWLVDIHGWHFLDGQPSALNDALLNVLRKKVGLPKGGTADPDLFLERVRGFRAVGRKGIRGRLTVGLHEFPISKSKRNGHFRGQFRIAGLPLDQLLPGASHGYRRLPLSVHIGSCRVSEPALALVRSGISVISDLDDTIKHSEVHDKKALLRNTFLSPFRGVEGMAELFQRLQQGGAAFHYVSASPWQLFSSLHAFLRESQFPEGSIHLRKFALKDMTFLKKLFPSHKGKRRTIDDLLLRCPDRKFLLFGDSGERDPEIYGDIARKYPEQVLGIFIRNVSREVTTSTRIYRAFMRVPPEKWVLFEHGSELSTLPLLRAFGELSPPAEKP